MQQPRQEARTGKGRLAIAMKTALAIVLVALGGSHGSGNAWGETAGFEQQVDEGNISFASPPESTSVELHGYFRSRGEMLYNLDLDHGLTPSGAPLFPVPPGDPKAQALTGANMRLRTDLRFRAPATGLSVYLRTDVLDNISQRPLTEIPLPFRRTTGRGDRWRPPRPGNGGRPAAVPRRFSPRAPPTGSGLQGFVLILSHCLFLMQN